VKQKSQQKKKLATGPGWVREDRSTGRLKNRGVGKPRINAENRKKLAARRAALTSESMGRLQPGVPKRLPQVLHNWIGWVATGSRHKGGF